MHAPALIVLSGKDEETAEGCGQGSCWSTCVRGELREADLAGRGLHAAGGTTGDGARPAGTDGALVLQELQEKLSGYLSKAHSINWRMRTSGEASWSKSDALAVSW